jgi:hypothetical protein
MTLIPMTRNYSMHSMPLERRHNVKGRQDSEGANMSMAVVHLNNKGGLVGRFTRSSSQRAQTTQTQTRIDTGRWSTKGKQVKTAIGKAWAKTFHTKAIPGIKADNPYFVVTVKETQRWGKQVFLSFLLWCTFFYVNEFDILILLQVRVSPFPPGGK